MPSSKLILKLSRFILLALLSLSFFVEASPTRKDYDLDNDGLIEINSIEDFNLLVNPPWSTTEGVTITGRRISHDEFGYSVINSTLYPGCPKGICQGFELTTDLDFDLNGNGSIEDEDWENKQVPSRSGHYMNHVWPKVDLLRGIFEGNGFTIKNMYLRANQFALFESSNYATIRNITIHIHSVGGQPYAGLVMRAYHTTFSNIKVTGNLTTGSSSSLIAHELQDGRIENCEVSGSIYTDSVSAGLLAGRAVRSSIENCTVSGHISSDDYSVGGLVGEFSSGSIINSHSTVSLFTGYGDIGGLVSDMTASNIVNSSFNGEISGSKLAGGLVASQRQGLIRDSFATGTIKGKTVGGLVGELYVGEIKNSFSSATLNSTKQAGGIAGNSRSSKIIGSFNEGAINGTQQVGGLVGNGENTQISACYNSGEVYGTLENGMGTGGLVGTSKKMKIQSSYAIGKVHQLNNSWLKFIFAPKGLGELVGVSNTTQYADTYWWDIDGGSGRAAWSEDSIDDSGLIELPEESLSCEVKDNSCSDTVKQFKSRISSSGRQSKLWIIDGKHTFPALKINGEIHRPSL